ncbi:VOC family protein [Brachybacterium sacelli]|uniref:Enzyme related to lactoylglutathione lyase n=1 Tax=Brachybacterium sacelli TaxID=173364 RepID=A0ABS4X6J2_9MICO|nr:VOC family protein [Brachybacterium sacelli]MBP2383951.1 putative enzyme related to lactoylglutathione lyase [Brachybacterium sacelli]
MTDTSAAPAPVARLAMITLDAAETEPIARFWHAVLGWPILHLSEEYAMLQGPSHALGIGAIGDHQRPSWPDDGRKQFHLDLAVADLEAAAARCVELGAERVAPQPGETWIVLRDPAGHAFCLTDSAAWG